MATATLTVSASAPSGYKYITIGTPDLSTTYGLAYGHSPTFAASDLVVFTKWYQADGVTSTWSVSVSTNGVPHFTHISGTQSLTMYYFIWDDSTSAYGTTAAYSVALVGGAVASGTLAVQNIVKWIYDTHGGPGGTMKRIKGYLNSQGQTGNTNTMMFKWLRSLGYTGTLTNMIDKFERQYTQEHG